MPCTRLSRTRASGGGGAQPAIRQLIGRILSVSRRSRQWRHGGDHGGGCLVRCRKSCCGARADAALAQQGARGCIETECIK